jgi:hypothetical protein
MVQMTPPPHPYATHDSDDKYDSDDEAGCGRVRYNGDGVNKKIGVDKKIPAKRDAPINLMRNTASKFFNWEYTLPFNTAPRSNENTFVNLLDYVKPNPK